MTIKQRHRPRKVWPQGNYLAEAEMPTYGLRRRYARTTTAGQKSSAAFMTIQTAVLIETLVELGAEVRWSSATFSRP